MSKKNNKKLREQKAKEIDKKKKEAKRLEKEWRKTQSELLDMLSERSLKKEEYESLDVTVVTRDVKSLDKDKLAELLFIERNELDKLIEASSSTSPSKPYILTKNK